MSESKRALVTGFGGRRQRGARRRLTRSGVPGVIFVVYARRRSPAACIAAAPVELANVIRLIEDAGHRVRPFPGYLHLEIRAARGEYGANVWFDPFSRWRAHDPDILEALLRMATGNLGAAGRDARGERVRRNGYRPARCSLKRETQLCDRAG